MNTENIEKWLEDNNLSNNALKIGETHRVELYLSDVLLKFYEEQVKNNDLLHSVSDSLPVACTMEDDKGELGWTRLSVNYAGQVITKLSKKVKEFENFIDSFNENYR